MFFLFSLGAEMIRAGSLPSHARAKRDKPQPGRGRGPSRPRGDNWVLGPSASEDLGALPEGAKQAASLAGFSPKLLDPAGAFPKARALAGARCKSVAMQTPLPIASGKSAKEPKSVPRLIQPLTLMIDKILPRTVIQTLHPGKTSSDLAPQ